MVGSIGDNIRRLRTEAGMSQTDLAKRLGKTRSAISQYETGVSVPRMGVIEKMSDIFNVPKSEIVDTRVTYAAISFDYREQLLVGIFKTLSDADKDFLIETARRLAK